MDLGVLLSFPRGVSPRLKWGPARALSSRAVAAVSRFPSRGSRVLWLSLELLPQGSPTCHRGVSRSLACKWKQCRENRFPWNGLRHLGDSGNGGTTLDFLWPSLWRVPPLEMRWERREVFPDHAGKGSTSRARRQKRGSSGCGRDSHASSRVETGMSGNFLSCSNGVKDPLEVPDVRCD